MGGVLGRRHLAVQDIQRGLKELAEQVLAAVAARQRLAVLWDHPTTEPPATAERVTARREHPVASVMRARLPFGVDPRPPGRALRNDHLRGSREIDSRHLSARKGGLDVRPPTQLPHASKVALRRVPSMPSAGIAAAQLRAIEAVVELVWISPFPYRFWGTPTPSSLSTAGSSRKLSYGLRSFGRARWPAVSIYSSTSQWRTTTSMSNPFTTPRTRT